MLQPKAPLRKSLKIQKGHFSLREWEFLEAQLSKTLIEPAVLCTGL
jgi:hypothetical protein